MSINDELLEIAKSLVAEIEGKSQMTKVRRIKKRLWQAWRRGLGEGRSQQEDHLSRRLTVVEHKLEGLEQITKERGWQ